MSSSSTSSESEIRSVKKALGWMEWLRGWFNLIHEMLFQRIVASHLQNPLPLPPLTDVTCIITGCTSGIGLETARQLAEAGAHLIMAVRKPKAAQELIQKWQNEPSGLGLPLNIEVMELDLLSFDSVVRFAEAWNTRLVPLHVLINNAGIFSIGGPQRFSKDKNEEHMQVNHLAPALLSMHYIGFVDPEDMNMVSGRKKYSSKMGYANSKLAQIMFSSNLQKRLPSESGISVLCVSPGIVDTNVARDLPKCVQAAYHLIPYFIFSPQEGSRSTLFAATDPQVPEYCEALKSDDWPVGAFISYECRPANPSEESHNLPTSNRVWEKTLEMIGLSPDVVEKALEGEPIKCLYNGNKQE